MYATNKICLAVNGLMYLSIKEHIRDLLKKKNKVKTNTNTIPERRKSKGKRTSQEFVEILFRACIVFLSRVNLFFVCEDACPGGGHEKVSLRTRCITSIRIGNEDLLLRHGIFVDATCTSYRRTRYCRDTPYIARAYLFYCLAAGIGWERAPHSWNRATLVTA